MSEYTGEMLTNAVARAHESATKAERERCANLVPTNWCDVLLSGPAAPTLPLDGPQLEALLLSIKQRIQNQEG